MEKFLTKEQYLTIKAAWATQPHATPALHIIYNLLRAKPLNSGFTPFKETSLDKIRSNYNDRWNGFNMALRNASSIITFGDTSVEYYLKTYGSKQKASMFGKIVGQADQVVLPSYIEDRRQREIAENIRNKADFVAHFGLEPTEDLCQRILAILKEEAKK